MRKLFVLLLSFVILPLQATKLDTVKVVDKDYVMLLFRDGIQLINNETLIRKKLVIAW